MYVSFRILTAMSLSTLVAIVVLIFQAAATTAVHGESFQPIKEAAMPQGFPAHTPVGQIEVKEYPAYRKASTSGPGRFWTLFRHINQNNVKMTAPVEMDFGDPSAETPRERTMSFLYERPDQGMSGVKGKVNVSDVPAMTVVSIGCRGNQTAAAVSEARRKLMTYLEENSQELAAAGPVRVMGYNSPFVPRDRNFFEVQIPVKPAESE
jgi:effector-binding domain-containing protein